MTSTSELDERTENAERWCAPTLDGGGDLLTAKRLQELQQQAFDEAYAEGLSAGRAAGAEEVERRAARLDELLEALAQPFERLDETVTEQLVALSIQVVRQLFRREISIEPTHVIGVVREALHLLPAAARDVEVRLHPDDARIVRESLTEAKGERAWRLIEDPLISRGGCNVRTADSQIDAETETRLRAAVSAIAGDERRPRDPDAEGPDERSR